MALPGRSVVNLAILVTLSCGFTSAKIDHFGLCEDELIYEGRSIIFGSSTSHIWFHRRNLDSPSSLGLTIYDMLRSIDEDGRTEVFQMLEIPGDRFLVVYAKVEEKMNAENSTYNDYKFFMVMYKFDSVDRWLSVDITSLKNEVPLPMDDQAEAEIKKIHIGRNKHRFSYYNPYAKALILGSYCYKIDESGGTTFTATKIDCAEHKLDNSCGSICGDEQKVKCQYDCMYEPCTNNRAKGKGTPVVAINEWFVHYDLSGKERYQISAGDESCPFMFNGPGPYYKDDATKIFGIKHSYNCKNGKTFGSSSSDTPAAVGSISSFASVASLFASLIFIALNVW